MSGRVSSLGRSGNLDHLPLTDITPAYINPLHTRTLPTPGAFIARQLTESIGACPGLWGGGRPKSRKSWPKTESGARFLRRGQPTPHQLGWGVGLRSAVGLPSGARGGSLTVRRFSTISALRMASPDTIILLIVDHHAAIGSKTLVAYAHESAMLFCQCCPSICPMPALGIVHIVTFPPSVAVSRTTHSYDTKF